MPRIVRLRSITSDSLALPGLERCERAIQASPRADSAQPGRLAQGPDEKCATRGRSLGCMGMSPVLKVADTRSPCCTASMKWLGRRTGSNHATNLGARRPASDVDATLEIEHGAARQHHPVTERPAVELAAAGRDLARLHVGLAEALAPIGHQGAVGGPGHRILGDAGSRREVARDEIDIATLGGD